jgi:hypothetical protein
MGKLINQIMRKICSHCVDFVSRYKNLLAYLLLVLAILLAFVSLEDQRRERVKALNFINTVQCQEIEDLKMQFREDAIEDYNRLDETLRLLKLKRTPELEARAKGDRDRVLRRFKEGTCPRVRIR